MSWKLLSVILLTAACVESCSCETSFSSGGKTTVSSNSNKDGYEIAHHDNFSSDNDFREADIYLEATISKFVSYDLFLTDSQGFEWVVTGLYEHDFSERVCVKNSR